MSNSHEKQSIAPSSQMFTPQRRDAINNADAQRGVATAVNSGIAAGGGKGVDAQWFYQTSLGTFGPASSLYMSRWVEEGHFHDDAIPVRTAEDDRFYSLGDYRRVCNHFNPFVVGVTSMRSALLLREKQRATEGSTAMMGSSPSGHAAKGNSSGNHINAAAIPTVQPVLPFNAALSQRQQPALMPSHYPLPQQQFVSPQPLSMGAGFPFQNGDFAPSFAPMGLHPAASMFQLASNMSQPPMQQPPMFHHHGHPLMYVSPAASVYSADAMCSTVNASSASLIANAAGGSSSNGSGLANHQQSGNQRSHPPTPQPPPLPPPELISAETQTEMLEIPLAEIEELLCNLLRVPVKINTAVAEADTPMEETVEEGETEDERPDSTKPQSQPHQPQKQEADE